MKITIKKEDIRCLLFIIPFLATDYFMRLDIVADIIKIWKVFVGIYAVIYVIRKKKVSYPLLLFSGMYLIITISSLYNGMFTLDPLMDLTFLWIVEYFSGNRQLTKRFFETFIAIGGILIIANFITMVLFPNGFYSTSVYNLNWLLGYKNVMIRRMIPILSCILANAEFCQRKLNLFEKIVLISAIVSLLMSQSVNSIVGIIIFIVLYVLICIDRFPKKITLCKISTIYLCLCLVIFSMGNFISTFNYLLVEVLDKNASVRARIAIWSRSIELILESPLIGYGNIDSIMYSFSFNVSHPHNLLLYYLMLGGVVGVGIWVIGIIIIDKNSRIVSKVYRGRINQIFLASYIVYFALGLLESLVGAIGFIPFMLLMYNINKNSIVNYDDFK